jgi:hypothetical protein
MIKEKSKPDTQTRRYGARKFAFGVLLSATRLKILRNEPAEERLKKNQSPHRLKNQIPKGAPPAPPSSKACGQELWVRHSRPSNGVTGVPPANDYFDTSSRQIGM